MKSVVSICMLSTLITTYTKGYTKHRINGFAAGVATDFINGIERLESIGRKVEDDKDS